MEKTKGDEHLHHPMCEVCQKEFSDTHELSGHINEYVRVDQKNWSRYPLENLAKVILVAYPDRFRLEEAKSLVESLQNEIVKVLPRNIWIVLNLEWVPVRQKQQRTL